MSKKGYKLSTAFLRVTLDPNSVRNLYLPDFIIQELTVIEIVQKDFIVSLEFLYFFVLYKKKQLQGAHKI